MQICNKEYRDSKDLIELQELKLPIFKDHATYHMITLFPALIQEAAAKLSAVKQVHATLHAISASWAGGRASPVNKSLIRLNSTGGQLRQKVLWVLYQDFSCSSECLGPCLDCPWPPAKRRVQHNKIGQRCIGGPTQYKLSGSQELPVAKQL